jgi:hypothetical protein
VRGRKTTTRETGRFVAKDDRGVEHTVRVLTTFAEAFDLDGNRYEDAGVGELILPDGGPLNRKGKGIYESVATGKTFRSDDPDAP